VFRGDLRRLSTSLLAPVGARDRDRLDNRLVGEGLAAIEWRFGALEVDTS
jgi:hypothetical protein